MVQSEQRGSVAEYYDTNTLPFLNVGGSGLGLAAIHRQVWAPGVVGSAAAFEYLNQLVLEWVCSGLGAADTVLDLGCGIGGTATWLAARADLKIRGVTLSAVQVDLAFKRAARLGLSHACDFVCGDMTDLPFGGQFGGAYAIESLIHVPESARFFEAAAGVLSPRARLVVCDDFIAESAPRSAVSGRWLSTFRRGWRADGLSVASQVKAAAARAGFELIDERDLTPYLRTVPAWLVTAGAQALRLPFFRGSYWDSLRGSTALQRCVHEGWTAYRALCWRRH